MKVLTLRNIVRPNPAQLRSLPHGIIRRYPLAILIIMGSKLVDPVNGPIFALEALLSGLYLQAD